MVDESISRSIRFDERRKVLSVKTEENKEAKLGEVNGGTLKFISDAEYNEEGIKMILMNAQKTKTEAEKVIPMFRERITELEEDLKKIGVITMTPELEQLKKSLEDLQNITQNIEPRKKELDNVKKMLENSENNLRQANKDIQEIQKEIGTRLNL